MSESTREVIRSVDVEQIMKEIRAKIAQEGSEESIPAFNSVPFEEQSEIVVTHESYVNAMKYMNENHYIPYYSEMPDIGIKRFIKRLILKIYRFQGMPLCDKQSAMNASFVESHNYLRSETEKLQYEIQILQDQVQQLYKENRKLREKNRLH